MSHRNKVIAAVIPCHNEEKLVEKVIKSIPDFVDLIIVINDGSTDGTGNIVSTLAENDERIIPILNDNNRGVGYSIKVGYRKAVEMEADISVVIAGDAQMDTTYFADLINPLIESKADYSKGNRLTPNHIHKMPFFRRIGNSLLTFINKLSTGYWEIIDPQNGYTAITSNAIKKILDEKITDGYGCPNDFLLALNIHNFKVVDVEIPAIYGKEKSGINIVKFIFKTSWLLLSGFFRRINKKYGGLRFHPIWLFYQIGIITFISGLCLGGMVMRSRIVYGDVSSNSVIFTSMMLIIGFQSLLFATFFDMENNRNR